MTNFEKVLEFHKAFNVEVDAPWTDNLIDLRQNLIDEEFTEVVQEMYPQEPPTYNKERLTKELCDLLYVVYGTGVALGLPLEEAFALVHESNMSKLGDDGKPIYREDGKVLKSPNYKKPDLSVLFT